MTDLDLVLSPTELAQLQAGYRLRLTPSLVPPAGPVISPPAVSLAGRHYSHARFCQLCYYGNPLGSVEQQLLTESIDLVVCGGDAGLMAKLNLDSPPATPIVLYTNVSNLYQDLLADWTGHAAAASLDAETAFLHDKASGSRIGYAGNAGRPLTNPAIAAFADWVIGYHQRLLQANPRATGFFVDNSLAKPPALPAGVTIAEDVSGYAAAYAGILGRLKNLGLVVPNTGGAAVADIDRMVAACGWWFQEFAIRALAHNWKQFEDLAGFVAGRLASGGSGILDSHPAGGSPTDPRTQLATLAYYYLLADPDRTYLDFFGGFAPGTAWNEHWCAAAAVDVGRPAGSRQTIASGPDPANPQANYRVYLRVLSKATVVYRPLSFQDWSTKADLSDASAVMVPVSGKPLAADGTIGPAVTSVQLRNGEGAILFR